MEKFVPIVKLLIVLNAHNLGLSVVTFVRMVHSGVKI